MQTLAVRREALYLGADGRQLFACFHLADQQAQLDCVAVICNPIGFEYIHSHRTLRHLADDLARAGVPALRFDYDGTGDSPGTDLDADRVSHWLEDIDTASAAARALSGRARVCLIGLRIGATLAALSTVRTPLDYLALWSPCVSGRRYVREMQALAQAADQAGKESAGAVEAAGFLMSAATQLQLKEINLLEQALQVSRRALVLGRDDLNEDKRFADCLDRLGIKTDTATFSGYADMMAEPQKTLVPQAALATIVAWLIRDVPPFEPRSQSAAARERAMRFEFERIGGAKVNLTETACRFGDDEVLFGVHTQPSTQQGKLPTVVLFNSGVAHRVGPNRLYVELARNLAAVGFATFRCDIEGIGDSVLRGPGRENHPYPDTAARDAEITLRFITERFGTHGMVVMGLCSGAYTSFKAGLFDSAAPIKELVLINPLTFDWHEGDSLDTQHFRAVAHYKGSMRRLDSWKKLLRGQVNVIHLGGVALSYLRKQIDSYINAVAERWFPSAGSLLSRQLRQIFGNDRKVSMFIASGDPGWDMVSATARYTSRKALKNGELHVEFIDDADHTFSPQDARLRLVAAVQRQLLRRHLQRRSTRG